MCPVAYLARKYTTDGVLLSMFLFSEEEEDLEADLASDRDGVGF